MFKKYVVTLSAFILLLGLTLSGIKPVLYGYADSLELYLNDTSSLAQIVKANDYEYALYKDVKGESVKLSADGFSLNELLSDFNATVRFIEQTPDCECYYAYSPKIKYKKTVKGQVINLQIAIAKEQVTIGSPLIFGSF